MSKLFQNFKAYFLYFLMYSMIGWVYEVFLEVVIYQWGFTNRGVLFGPWCPVYGVGTMAFLLCFDKLMKKRKPLWLQIIKPLLIFIGCMAVATAIELVTSYILEALIGYWPWMYDTPINFEGRIALSPSIRFGLGGLFFLYILQPIFELIVRKLPKKAFNIVFWVLLAVFITDCIATIIL